MVFIVVKPEALTLHLMSTDVEKNCLLWLMLRLVYTSKINWAWCLKVPVPLALCRKTLRWQNDLISSSSFFVMWLPSLHFPLNLWVQGWELGGPVYTLYKVWAHLDQNLLGKKSFSFILTYWKNVFQFHFDLSNSHWLSLCKVLNGDFKWSQGKWPMLRFWKCVRLGCHHVIAMFKRYFNSGWIIRPLKGSKWHYLLGQNTTCKCWGESPSSSYDT